MSTKHNLCRHVVFSKNCCFVAKFVDKALVDDSTTSYTECTTFAPATIALVINANVKRNPNPNPNPDPNLNPYPTPNQKPNHYPHSNSLLSEISSPEQLSPEQMSDHPYTISVSIKYEKDTQ